MDTAPVVIGIGDIQQKDNFDNLDEALVLMNKVTEAAINDCGNKNIVNYLDEIRIPKGYWKYRDPGKWIANKNNFSKTKTYVTKIGVLQQNLINSACKKILSGEINGSLIVGGESRYKRTKALIEKKDYEETELNINPDFYIKAKDDLYADIEKKELGMMAVGYYSIIESSLRARSSKSFNQHHDYIAKFYSEFSKIASKNDVGWIDNPIKPDEILNSSNINPEIAFPYNKFHCSSWNVNQAAGLIICSSKVADLLNIDKSKRVYLLASSENNFMIPTLLRPNLSKSYGMNLAAEFILNICKENNISEIIYDLYSCFPAAVEMFGEALKIKNISQSSITGGMSFAGGPLNSYVLNSTVQMIRKIRSEENKYGIVTGISGMMTKQSFALWGKRNLINYSFKDVSEEAENHEVPYKISSETSGEGNIIGYTVIKNEESVKKAVIYIEDVNKNRNIITSENKEVIESMEINEWVGKWVKFKNLLLIV